MIKLTAKNNTGKTKIAANGNTCRLIATSTFRGSPANLLQHMDNGSLRWVLLADDPQFEMEEIMFI